MLKRKRTKESEPEVKNARSESRRQAPDKRLWERSREERKETNSKAEYRNRERTHGKPGGAERGKPRKRKQNRSTEEATVRRRQEEKGKEEQRRSSQNPKLKRPKGSENSGGQKEKRKRRSAVKVEAQRSQKAKARKQG